MGATVRNIHAEATEVGRNIKPPSGSSRRHKNAVVGGLRFQTSGLTVLIDDAERLSE